MERYARITSWRAGRPAAWHLFSFDFQAKLVNTQHRFKQICLRSNPKLANIDPRWNINQPTTSAVLNSAFFYLISSPLLFSSLLFYLLFCSLLFSSLLFSSLLFSSRIFSSFHLLFSRIVFSIISPSFLFSFFVFFCSSLFSSLCLFRVLFSSLL